MDHKVFLVRTAGVGAAGKTQKAATRIFRISDNGISVSGTLPNVKQSPEFYSFERINQALPSPSDPTELTIDIFGGFNRPDDTLRFFCDSRTALLTTLHSKLDDVNGLGIDYFLKKHSSKHGGLVDTIFRVRNSSVVKVVNTGARQEKRKMNTSKKFNLCNIEKVEILADNEHILLLYFKSRAMRLSMKDSLPFLQAIRKNMKTFLNIDLEVGKITTNEMVENVSAYLRKGEEGEVQCEFQAIKCFDGKPQRHRIFTLTTKHFIEKSPDEVIAVHSLDDLMGVIVPVGSTNEVILEFKFWRPTLYAMEDRDGFIASITVLMDTRKYKHFSIHHEPFLPGTFPDRPHSVYLSECETYYTSQFMVLFNSYQDRKILIEVLKEYACNIHVGDSQCTDVRIIKAVTDLLQSCIRRNNEDINCATLCCLALRSLLGSRAIFEAMRTVPETFTVLIQCAQSSSSVLSYLAAMVIRSSIKFMANAGPVDNISKLEAANRLVALSADNMQQLVATLYNHSLTKNSELQILGLLEVLLTAVSYDRNEIEFLKTWLKNLEASVLVASKVICEIFRCSSFVVFQRNSLLLRSLISNSSSEIQNYLQNQCLNHGVVLVHLKNALFSQNNEIWKLSADLLFLMMEGNDGSRRLLESILPKGIMLLYQSDALDDSSSQISGHDESIIRLSKWIDMIEVFRKNTFATPLLVWNDTKRQELYKFLEGELENFYNALDINRELQYNSEDIELSADSEASSIGGVHLELLPDQFSMLSIQNDVLWQIKDPVSLFQSVFQAMVLGFTPFFGHNNLPEVDLKLAAHALTWIYEQHAENLLLSLTSLNVIEIVVGMLREVIETEHEVFVFKLLVFLLAVIEHGGRTVARRFVRAGGISVLVQFAVLSLSKCCKDKTLFECDAWDPKSMRSQGSIENVEYIGFDGTHMSIRVPAGKARDVLDKALLDGSLDAKQAIRWQDETVPSKVQLGLSLDLLESILSVSGGDDNAECFPPSLACTHLAREEVLCYLVQMLLRAKTPTFGRILEMISYATTVNDAMKEIYKYGMFEILLWKLLGGNIIDSEKRMIIKFLRRFHLSQEMHVVSQQHSPWQSSILSLYFPQGLIVKLNLEDDDTFLSLLDSDIDDPEIIWNSQMKENLLEYLTKELEAYVKSRSSDALALHIHTAKPPLEYPELAEAIFVAPFYIHNLLNFDRFPNYQVNDPVGFLNNLMQVLRKFAEQETDNVEDSSGNSNSLWKKEIHHIHMLLQSQAFLLERHSISTLPNDLETVVIKLATPALETCLLQRNVSPSLAVDIVFQTTTILRRFCATNLRSGEVAEKALEFSIQILFLGTCFKEDSLYPESMCNSAIEPAISGSLLVLEVLCSSSGRRQFLRNDNRWIKGLWWALSSAVGDATANPPKGPTATSFAALKCLKCFVEDDKDCLNTIEQGLYLPLLLLAIPPAESDRNADKCNSAIFYTAADVLGSLVNMLVKIEQFPISKKKDSSPVLSKIIPHLLIQSLREKDGAEKFLSLVSSDIMQPTAIWNSVVRKELWEKVCAQLKHYSLSFANGDTMPMKNEVDWLQNFRYDCLKDEPIIGGLYVRGLCFGKVEDFSLPEGPLFLDEIQEYLINNLDSLIQSFNDVTSQKNQARYIAVLVSLRQCIHYAVKRVREDLIEHIKPEVLLRLVSVGYVLQDIQVETSKIVKILSELQFATEKVLHSVIMNALALQLWHAARKKGSEHILISTLEATVLLSESMPAGILVTNCFATSGVLLSLLAFFCKVEIPMMFISKDEEGTEVESLPPATQLLAAQAIGQLLLSASGINRRAKVLKQLAKLKSFAAASFRGTAAKSDDSIEATDMYALLNLIDPNRGLSEEEPLVIKVLLQLFPIELLSAAARDPSEACDVFNGNSRSPFLVWDNGTRLRVKTAIKKEIEHVSKLVAKEMCTYAPFNFLNEEKPVFLRWVRVVASNDEKFLLYSDTKAEGYAPELYIGGFYIDQFLRNPEFDLGPSLEDRFLHEVRKAIVIGASGLDFDAKRRLLIALLLLFKLRPNLLSRRSNNDIFLPVLDFLATVQDSEHRGLAQPAILVLHCSATYSDLADCMCSEDLFGTLSQLLDLDVPQSYAGFAGTDPQLCALSLILRLARLSSKAVELALQTNMVPKLIQLIRPIDNNVDDTEDPAGLTAQKAAECIVVMCADKRKGQEVNKVLDKYLPKDLKQNSSWRIPLPDIRDEMVDSKTLNHFLRHQYPSEWWTSHHFSNGNGNEKKDWTQ